MNIKNWIEKYATDCDIKYPSLATRKTYKAGVLKFLNHFKNEVEPKSISNQDVKEWLLTFTTHNTRKQMQCSVNSFYKLTVKMPNKIASIPYPKKAKTLPLVIDSDHLKNTINGITNLKHKAILMLAYSCALRVSEVINLRIEDIDSQRMLINIRNAKGQKDRIVKMSDHLLDTLRVYYKNFSPKDTLFNGANGLHYTRTSCSKIVKKYLGPKYKFHTLRHSGATSMLENGTDLSVIQKLLGHNSIKTTMIYTHISSAIIQNVNPPM